MLTGFRLNMSTLKNNPNGCWDIYAQNTKNQAENPTNKALLVVLLSSFIKVSSFQSKKYLSNYQNSLNLVKNLIK